MSGFGDRFSASQRAALQALGFGVLERAEPGAPWVDGTTHDVEGVPGHAGRRTRNAVAAATGSLPSRVVIDGIGEDAPLLRGILAVIHARLGTEDSRVLRTSSALRIDTGGPGPQWRVHAEELRASPRRKAALWRALRQLERMPRG